MDTEDLRLADLGDDDGDNVSLDNLPKIKSHRSIGRNHVFSTPPTYTKGRFSSQGKDSRLSIGNQPNSDRKTKSPYSTGTSTSSNSNGNGNIEKKHGGTAEIYDPETGVKKKLNNNYVGVNTGRPIKTYIFLGIAIFLFLGFMAFVIYTIIRLQNETCPEDYICWGENA